MRKPIQAVDVLGLNQAGFYDLRHYGYDASSPSPASIHKWCLAGLLLIGSFSLFASPASAGLFFCNNSGQEISVAIGWSQDNKWVSKGWFTVNPGQCDATLLGMLTNRVYYYYAESEGRTLTWGGHGENDAGYFCTSQDAFYLDSSSNDCEGHNFKRLWVGEEHQFTVTLTERRTDPTSAAYNCRSSMEDGMDSFAKCWTREIATGKQRRILDCIDRMNSKASLALCASKDYLSMDLYDVASCANKYNETREGDQFLTCVSKGRLSEQEQKVFNCALENRGNLGGFGSCAALGQLTPQQRRIYNCAYHNYDNYVRAGLCAAGGQLTPEQSRVAGCVLNNVDNYGRMAVCAVGNNLTPEQEVFAGCAVSTGGQPYAFAGCVGSQLTKMELQKCFTHGIGGSGCFGQNNTVVKFVNNAWKDVTEGPGPSNDLLGRDGFIGRKLRDAEGDLRYGAGSSNDLVGRCGFMGRTLFGSCP